jgi:hypothetical protein
LLSDAGRDTAGVPWAGGAGRRRVVDVDTTVGMRRPAPVVGFTGGAAGLAG